MGEPDPIPLRFLDVCFGDGVPDRSLTLWPADLLTFEVDRIVIEFREKSHETVVLFLDQIKWYALGDGVYRPLPLGPDGKPVPATFEQLRERLRAGGP